MKLKKFFGVLVALCLMLFVVGGVVTKGTCDTKLIAGIGGGGHEVESCTTAFPF